MDARLAGTGIALFLVGYAQASPLFTLFGAKANIVLALAILVAFSFNAFYEYIFLVLVAACGLAAGIGFIQAFLFFAAVFAMAQGARRALPWQPFLVGCMLVIFFSLLTYVSLDWGLMVRLAPPAAREALYNLMVFVALYALMPPRYARHGRIH
ncbi:MAG: hypothetical protein EXS60_01955 [Candidatus Pacebacteria bacterium]|nr:hypothetical protein [Candidatus Paceibacterota bacterium]